MPLPSSFWVDEMGTAFVVHHGKADPTLRIVPQVTDSIYFILPAIAQKIAGFNEISYRFFSVLAMGGTLLFVAKIAARLIGVHAAWFATFACLALRDFNYEAADARPYALGSLLLALAIFELIRWFDSGRLLDGFIFAVAAGLLWWVHLIFWPFYILFAFYAGWRVFTGTTSVRPIAMSIVTLAVLAGAIPVALRSLALLHQAGAHTVVPKPRIEELEAQLKLSLVTGVTTLGILVARYLRWPQPQFAIARSAVVLIAGWWLIDPLAIYAFSQLSSTSVFVSRYMFLAAPGIALMMALLISMIVPDRHWKQVTVALALGVLIFAGHWRVTWPPHHNSDWRGAAQSLRTWTGGEAVPVIAPSPFIEARPPVWRPDYPIESFLYSHLDVYPMGGKIYPFPFDSSPEAEDYAHRLSVETLARTRRFAIYGGDRAVELWRNFFLRQAELRGWRSRVLGTYGDVRIVVFEL
jgi:hypothetical protein